MFKKLNDFAIGFIVGILIFALATLSFATISSSRQDREFEKFIETSGGETAVLIRIIE